MFRQFLPVNLLRSLFSVSPAMRFAVSQAMPLNSLAYQDSALLYMHTVVRYPDISGWAGWLKNGFSTSRKVWSVNANGRFQDESYSELV
ncbi:MAG: hypothetical protein WAZ34_06155 [Rhodocyclaceae bacterium]